MRAVLYSRVSTDQQEKEHTIQSQVEALRAYAASKGYQVVAEYQDDGYSGATLQRPGLDRLRDGMQRGDYDVAVFHSPDRLARKAVYQGLILEEMETAGVKVEFLNCTVDDSPEGKVLLGVQGLFAEYERTKITERNRRGRQHWARQGVVMAGFTPYGYRRVGQDHFGPDRRTLVPEEFEADIVRQAYQWLVDEGLSCRGIARRLTDRHVPTRTGSLHWSPSTVNQLLRNEAYKGVVYYGKARQEVHSSPAPYPRPSRLRQPKYRPRDEWIAIPITAIVDEATWQRAQAQLNLNSQHSRRNNTRNRYLLRGLIRCPRCGGTYCGHTSSKGQRRYHCNRTDPLECADGSRCGVGSVKADALESTVWTAITQALLQPEALKAEYEHRVAAMGDSSDVDARRRQMYSSLKAIENKRQRANAAYIAGIMELPDYSAIVDGLRTQAAELERQLADIEHQTGQQLETRTALRQIETFCQSIALGLDALTFEEKQAVLQLLIERITVERPVVRIEAVIPLGNVPPPDVLLRPQLLRLPLRGHRARSGFLP